MKAVFYVTVLCLVLNLLEILSYSFPPASVSQPLVILKNYTMAKYMKTEFFAFNTIALIELHGYHAEEHIVTTEDGYIIKIFRIRGNSKNYQLEGKPVILLQHGMFASSDSWVFIGPNRDLAFMLADANYDVWLTNIRDNSYGKAHVKWSPDKDKQFWQFSTHENAVYDLSASIDYILNICTKRSLTYVGYSQGVTMGAILLSSKPEYNSKIQLFICFGPVVFWKKIKFPPIIEFFMYNTLLIEIARKALELFNIYELAPRSSLNILTGKTCFEEKSIFRPLCIASLFYWSGVSNEQFNSTIWLKASPYFPDGTSVQSLLHFHQNVIRRNFEQYDYGSEEMNIAKYGRPKPAAYNLKNIVAPVALFYGKTDRLVSFKDVKDLKRILPNVVHSEAVPVHGKEWNHFDFAYGNNAKTLLYDRVLSLISKYMFESNN